MRSPQELSGLAGCDVFVPLAIRRNRSKRKHSVTPHFPQVDFWPGSTSGWPLSGRKTCLQTKWLMVFHQGSHEHGSLLLQYQVSVARTGTSSPAFAKMSEMSPRPGLAVAPRRPPCDSTIERLIAKSMPMEFSDGYILGLRAPQPNTLFQTVIS